MNTEEGLSEQDIQNKAVEEGRNRDEILFSFKAIGLTELLLGLSLVLLGIITAICSAVTYPWFHQMSMVCGGVWCGLFSIPAGIMSFIASKKVSYFNVGWAMICSITASCFMFVLLVLSCIGTFETIDGISSLHILLMIFALAQFSLCLYSSIVFGRMYASYPYHTFPGNELISCGCCYQNSPNNFAHVMYSNVAMKKHDY